MVHVPAENPVRIAGVLPNGHHMDRFIGRLIHGCDVSFFRTLPIIGERGDYLSELFHLVVDEITKLMRSSPSGLDGSDGPGMSRRDSARR
jgi:hypothetical protein